MNRSQLTDKRVLQCQTGCVVWCGRVAAVLTGWPLTAAIKTALKQLQSPLKAQYRDNPESAVVTLRASGSVGEGIACKVSTGQAIVEVYDQGGGVPEAELERLFEPFYRASTSGESQGTGLGLAIVARAIGIHDGLVDARNTDAGLCVVVRLPLQANSKETA